MKKKRLVILRDLLTNLDLGIIAVPCSTQYSPGQTISIPRHDSHTGTAMIFRVEKVLDNVILCSEYKPDGLPLP